MTAGWKTVKLGELLSRTGHPVDADPSLEYCEITVRLWGKGVIERGCVTGAQVNGRRFVARTGNFIASRIDARNGAMGLVPESLDGALVTNDFPLFEANKDRLDLDYLGWLSKTADFVELCLRASEGTTNRVRLKEERFFNLEIPLPPLAEQRRIVARIEALAAQIDEAKRLRKEAVEEAAAMVASSRLAIFSELVPIVNLGSICEVIDPNPSHRYPVYVEDGVPIISSSEFTGEDGIDPRLSKRVPDSFYESTLGRYGVGDGDVIFSRKGKVGYARLHPSKVRLAMTHTLCVMKVDHSKVVPRYLLHFARSPVFLEGLTGTMNPNVGVPTLGLGVIRDANIPIPPLPEQRRIVAELDALQAEVDGLKRLQAETAAELDALLPAILDRAFKGEL